MFIAFEDMAEDLTQNVASLGWDLNQLIADHQISLRVQDNGVGLPDNFDLQHISSLGLNLVQNLSKQIKGDVVIAPQPVGFAFQITFPA